MRTSNAISVTAVGLMAGLGLAACGGGGGGGGGGDATAGAMGKPAAVSVKRIQGANVLVDSGGRALYFSDQEKGGKVLCKGGCTTIWDPASASGATPALSGGKKLEVVRRPDGSRQLALGHKPLYRFTQEGAGQLTGNGVVDSFGGTRFRWHAATAGKGARSAPPAKKRSPGGYGY
jgi:predicted lipoprotein with Yx(FWY)xxD motif